MSKKLGTTIYDTNLDRLGKLGDANEMFALHTKGKASINDELFTRILIAVALFIIGFTAGYVIYS